MPIFLLLLLALNVFAHEQLILVVSKDFNNSKAQLYTYEKNNDLYQKKSISFPVQLGRNGLGWGLGIKKIAHQNDEPIKKEGDGKAPAGIFLLGKSFGYDGVESKLDYIQADKNLICVDDVTSEFYNQLREQNLSDTIKSFEYMRREDNLYAYGLVVQHNTQAKKGAGSCIFMHIWRNQDAPTSGCTAMDQDNIIKLLAWLNKKSNPLLIQIPQAYCPQIEKLYPGLVCRKKSF